MAQEAKTVPLTLMHLLELAPNCSLSICCLRIFRMPTARSIELMSTRGQVISHMEFRRPILGRIVASTFRRSTLGDSAILIASRSTSCTSGKMLQHRLQMDISRFGSALVPRLCSTLLPWSTSQETTVRYVCLCLNKRKEFANQSHNNPFLPPFKTIFRLGCKARIALLFAC